MPLGESGSSPAVLGEAAGAEAGAGSTAEARAGSTCRGESFLMVTDRIASRSAFGVRVRNTACCEVRCRIAIAPPKNARSESEGGPTQKSSANLVLIHHLVLGGLGGNEICPNALVSPYCSRYCVSHSFFAVLSEDM